jgi:DNA invertase Pin-like site-specific DNA recombinase
VGVVRVPRVGDRDGERFVSPKDQRERIAAECASEGLNLVNVLDERDVSGGAPLERRPGLRHAVEMVEAGDADVVVVAFFDRLVRSLTVQAEVVERVEQAGGRILAVDGRCDFGHTRMRRDRSSRNPQLRQASRRSRSRSVGVSSQMTTVLPRR